MDGPPERAWVVKPSGSSVEAFVDGIPIARSDDWWGVVLKVQGDIELWVATHALGCVVIHACAVSCGDAALVVPGPSMAGKTTLARALVRSGAQYYSDEYAVIDERGLVTPYPRRPAVRVPGRNHKIVTALLDSAAGAAPIGEAPVPVGLIADVRFFPGPNGLDVRPMTPGMAALSLLGNAVAARVQNQQVLQATAAAASQAHAVVGTRGEAASAAGELLELLRSTSTAGSAGNQ